MRRSRQRNKQRGLNGSDRSRTLVRAPVKAIEVPLGDTVNGQQNEYVGRSEDIVDHRTIADKGAKAEVRLDERWELPQGFTP